MARKYYLFIDDERRGPFAMDQLLDAGMDHDTLVWFKGCADWMPARDVAELETLLEDLPPPAPTIERPLDLHVPYEERHVFGPYRSSRGAYIFAGLMAVLAGALGLFAFLFDSKVARDHSLQGIQTTAILIAILCGGLGVLGLLLGTIAFLVFLYRAWAIIQDGRTSVSPGAAVGLFFVPLFNHFWVFAAVAGLPKQLNQYAHRHRLRAPRASTALGSAVAVYFLMSAIPFLGIAYMLLNLIIITPFMTSIYRTVRCFCAENRERLDPQSDPEVAISAAPSTLGIPAIFLAFFGFPALLIGGFFTPLKWGEYEMNVAALERAQANPAPRDRFALGPDFFRRRAEKTWNELIYSAVLLVGGLSACTAAIGLALVAARRNRELDTS